MNLIARFPTQRNSAPSFLLCSHYDTKTFDSFRFVGANDAGSSTGLLLELGRVLGQHPDLAAKIGLVFFDGEEAYEHFSEKDGLYGSRYFARQLGSSGAKQFRGGILFDMVGDRSLTIIPGGFACGNDARSICIGGGAEIAKSFHLPGPGIDRRPHTAERAGIPTIDVIDFDFPWWHTADDTIDKVSGESLQIVGSVAAYYLSEFELK